MNDVHTFIIEVALSSRNTCSHLLERCALIYQKARTNQSEYPIDTNCKTGRRLIKAPTKEKLYLKLAEAYGIIDNPNGLTMQDLYKKWIPYKRSITNSENTIYRHYDHWRKYCEKCDIIKKPIKKISVIELESWANELIKDHNMTRKEWQNVKVIIGGIWDYAHRKGYISKNTWKEIRIC